MILRGDTGRTVYVAMNYEYYLTAINQNYDYVYYLPLRFEGIDYWQGGVRDNFNDSLDDIFPGAEWAYIEFLNVTIYDNFEGNSFQEQLFAETNTSVHISTLHNGFNISIDPSKFYF
ncbi:MAG: hypothetical protein LIO79_00850 [Rikenellaceae bacterium]|nr:hypothetical protein [Rikenellaceae bacterium]